VDGDEGDRQGAGGVGRVGQNPGRAADEVTFNVLTTVFTGDAGAVASGAGKAGAVARVLSVAGKGKFENLPIEIGRMIANAESVLRLIPVIDEESIGDVSAEDLMGDS
jgi:hypothetical protein